MKKYIFLALLPAIAFISCDKDKDNDKNNTPKDVSLSMGAELVYDVYYSFENGEVAKVKRSDWDIALSVPLQTASILINEGSGVELYPAGLVADWSSIDGSTVNPANRLWNDKADWLKGAFNNGVSSANPFNYGWGTYNQSTHNVDADSVYIIKLTNGDFKKIKLFKNGMANSYQLTWADIDGTETDSATVEMTSASAKHFVHYSIKNKQVIDYEPVSDAWDLLLTVYSEKIPAGPGVFMDYPVMGILTNQGYQVVKVTDKSPETAALSDSTSGFQKAANSIGWDWKTNVPQTADYTVTENLSYFVKNAEGMVYQIYFTSYDGRSTGNIGFKTRFIE